MRSSRIRSYCALAAVFSSLAACNSGSDEAPPEGLSSIVARTAPRQATATVQEEPEPTSYRIAYARYSSGRAEPTRFVTNVIRPFNERGTAPRSLGFAREAENGEPRVTFVRPLADEARPRVYPPQSRKVTTRRIAGRLCDSYRIGSDELCIDGAGLVLMTRAPTVVDIATQVRVGDESLSAAELAAPLAKGFADPGRGSIRPIDPDSAPPGTDYSLDAAPAGFALVGRYAVAPLTAEVLRKSRKVIANIVDVYVRGPDAVVVERGGKLDLTAVTDADIGTLDGATEVDLGMLGTGLVGIGGVGPFGYREVRAFPAPGRYVVVAGTLPADELVAIMRSLRAWPGTAIKYLDR
jgi:hypothetical protein